MPEENSLVARSKKGDLQAFEQLIKSLQARLYRVAFLLSGNREEAEDLLQDTFLNLYQSLPRFQGRSMVYTYAYRILINLHRRRVRKRKRVTEPLLEDIVASTPSGTEIFAKQEQNERLRVAISKLPPLLQEVIVLRYLEELSYQEIATRLGINEGTVKSRLHNAKRGLRKILTKKNL